MNARSAFPLSLLALAAALFVTAFAITSCAPKVTGVDDSYRMPEGIPSSDAQLIVWTDAPAASYFYEDNPPADPDATDELVDSAFVRRYVPGTIHGMIVDRTLASEYELFRREGGGGVRPFTSFMAERVRQWLGTQYEVFEFVDPSPAAFSPPTYIARGKQEGVANPSSPLTNLAQLTTPAITNIPARAVWLPASRTIQVRWPQVTDAVRYLIQVYEFRPDLRTLEERFLSGTPAPLYSRFSTDLFVGYVPGNINIVSIGGANPPEVIVFQTRPMTFENPYMVRVAAFDAQGRMIGLTLGNPDPIRAFANGEMGLQRNAGAANIYRLYRLAATSALDTLRQGPGGGGGG